jgi:hypothetical protein
MSQQMIYSGRFIDTPTPNDIRIREGAVLVSNQDGTGVIEKADWTGSGSATALQAMCPDAQVVESTTNGFFFPGFIGEYSTSKTVAHSHMVRSTVGYESC